MSYPHLSEALPQLARPEEVAPFLGLTKETVRDHLKAGKLPGQKIGGRWLVHVEKLRALMDGSPIAPVPSSAVSAVRAPGPGESSPTGPAKDAPPLASTPRGVRSGGGLPTRRSA